MKNIFLLPGDFYVSEQSSIIRTLLGSCVALVFWHPERKIGVMSHFVLPSRVNDRTNSNPLNGRYADEFMQLLKGRLYDLNTRHDEYLVSAYGAANMFKQLNFSCEYQSTNEPTLCTNCKLVSCKNRSAALTELEKHGFKLFKNELGGTLYRAIEFNTQNGAVTVKQSSDAAS